MKKIIVILCLLSCSLGYTQKSIKYSQAKITYNTRENLKKLIELRLPMDHGLNIREGFIISNFSTAEIDIARRMGLQVEILIDDTQADFIRRNKIAKTQKRVQNIECPSEKNYYPTPANFALGSMGGFLTYQEMLDNLDAMRAKYPTLISARANIGDFVTNGFPDNTVSPSIGGNALQWVRISDNPDVDENEPEILYDAVHHSGEPLTLSQLIYYMWYLLENYDSDPEIKQIVNHTALYFIPVVNPDGYLYNQKIHPDGGGGWRGNRSYTIDSETGEPYIIGMDLNRDYDYYPTGDPSSSTSWGNPFSQPETQAMKWFVEQHDFIIALNNHSYSNLLLFPFGYEVDKPTPDNDIYLSISEAMVEQNEYKNGLTTTLMYTTPGNGDDFMYGTVGTHDKIFAFTPEIGPNHWPTYDKIDNICKTMMYLNLTTAKMANNYAVVKDNSKTNIDVNYNSFYASFDVRRIGLRGNGNFTVRIIPVSDNIKSVGRAKNYTNVQKGNVIKDSTIITLEETVGIGDTIEYQIQVDSGLHTHTITVNKNIGELTTIIDNKADTFNEYIVGDGWKINPWFYKSAPGSIRNTVKSFSNQDSSIELAKEIDLTKAFYATVEFNVIWVDRYNYNISNTHTQFEVSTDNGVSWTPQCGKYTRINEANEPYYGGFPYGWVLEEINLNDYLGETIKIRFQFMRDEIANVGSFSFDDLKVKVLYEPLAVADAAITPAYCNEMYKGAIDITVAGGVPPYTYEWYANWDTLIGKTEDIKNLNAGFYRVMVEDAKGTRAYKFFEVINEVDWTDLDDGIEVNPATNTLVKTGASSWSTGAASSNLLVNRGFLQFNIEKRSVSHYFIGLSDKNIADPHSYKTIDYAFYYNGSNHSIGIFESGIRKRIIQLENEVNTFQIIKYGDKSIEYYVNNSLEYTSQKKSSTPLLVDVSILNAIELPKVEVSFCNDVVGDLNKITFKNFDVFIYPNPSKNGIFEIKTAQKEDFNVTVLDVNGRALTKKQLKASSSTYKLDLSKYEAGIYFAKLENDSKTQVHKLIIE